MATEMVETTADIFGKVYVEDVDKLYPIAYKTLEDGDKLYIYEFDAFSMLVGKNKQSLKRVIIEFVTRNFKQDGYFEYREEHFNTSAYEHTHYLSEFKTIPENYIRYKEEHGKK